MTENLLQGVFKAIRLSPADLYEVADIISADGGLHEDTTVELTYHYFPPVWSSVKAKPVRVYFTTEDDDENRAGYSRTYTRYFIEMSDGSCVQFGIRDNMFVDDTWEPKWTTRVIIDYDGPREYFKRFYDFLDYAKKQVQQLEEGDEVA